MPRVRRRRPDARLTRALLLPLLLAAALAGPTLAVPASGSESVEPRTTARATSGSLQRDVVATVNRVRGRHGCAPLKVVDSLRLAARRHSRLMARRGVLSHRLAGEPTLRRRTAAAGYTGATMLGETIATGGRTAGGVVRMWLDSRRHRAILLDCRFRAIGAGVAYDGAGRRWWTVDVGRR